jgi:hypothetical protein
MDQLSRKIELFRSGIETLDPDSWRPELGAPADISDRAVPDGLAELYGIVDGLNARLHVIDTLEVVTDRLSAEPSDLHDPTPGVVQVGNTYYSFILGFSVDDGTVRLVDGDEYIEAVVHQKALTPMVLAASPVEFLDSYLLGPRYLELIELVGGYQVPEDEKGDEWRLVLEEVKLL